MAGINNLKNVVMKKSFIILILSIALVSCYDEYIKDFDYSSVYFPYQVDVRSVIVGEGINKMEIGVTLGGVMNNTRDRNVSFILDNALITPEILTKMQGSTEPHIKAAVASLTTLLPLPPSYYTLSNGNTMVIKPGQSCGTVTLKVDSIAFLSDPGTIKSTYVLPFYITTADVDTIIQPKRYNVVGIKYENMLFGNYLHGGVTTVKDAAGTTIQTITYVTAVNQTNSQIWSLTTAAPNAVVSNGYSNQTSTTKTEIKLTLNGTDITVGSATGSTNTYSANGASTYNAAKLLQNRKILLNYKYVVGANTYYCQDTLTFRNRLRDGVNEWQDEDPSHY
jgi:hypothetical protein